LARDNLLVAHHTLGATSGRIGIFVGVSRDEFGVLGGRASG
jgi:hypothetical protein